MPSRPLKCIGKKASWNPRNTIQKLILPSASSIMRPVIFGYQKVEYAKQREHRSPYEHVMEVRDDEVGVVQLQIEWDRRR